jgi:hypothetical protein
MSFSQDYYLITEMELDRLKNLSEAFHFAWLQFIESRRIRTPHENLEEDEFLNLNSIIEEIDGLSAENKNREF